MSESKKRDVVFWASTPINPISRCKNYLLLIGIDKYEHLDPLNNAVKDVVDFFKVLTERYHFNKEETVLLLDEKANRDNIINAFEKLVAQVKEDDHVIIYFSGHGTQDSNTKRGYWLPVDAMTQSRSKHIRNSTIKDYLDDLKARHVLTIVDSCFSGALLRKAEKWEEKYKTDEFDTQKWQAYHDRVHLRTSRWLLTSGREEVVSDGPIGKNSPFAQRILHFLGRNPQQYLPASDLARFVKREVPKTYQQAPYGGPILSSSLHQDGDFFFYLKEKVDQVSNGQENEVKGNEGSSLVDSIVTNTTNRARIKSWLSKKPVYLSMGGISLIALIWFIVNLNPGPGGFNTIYQSADSTFREGKKNDDHLVVKSALIQFNKIEDEKFKKRAESKKRECQEWLMDFLDIKMITVPGGFFRMGSTTGSDNSKPRHLVEISTFEIGKYEVTRKQYRTVMELDPSNWSSSKCDNCPVDNVTWFETQIYIEKLNELTGSNFRLPSEAEWEYAASGGKKGLNPGGHSKFKYAGGNNLTQLGWYNDTKTHLVGEKKPNGLGIYDMSGNVKEWCQDNWHDNYIGAPENGQAWEESPGNLQKRVRRGGCWRHNNTWCYIQSRDGEYPSKHGSCVGFRLARIP